MNHILIRFLINLFFVSSILSNNLESWLSQIKNVVDTSSTLQLSMRLESAQVSNLDSNIIDEGFYLKLNLSDNIYQIKYLDNIIYYNGSIVLQYNTLNNQLFKYLPDKNIENYLDKKIFKDFFNFNNYKADNSKEGYQYRYSNFTLGLNSNIYISSLDNLISILFINDIYKMVFDQIEVTSFDLESFQKDLLINQYKNNKDIEIFDFSK